MKLLLSILVTSALLIAAEPALSTKLKSQHLSVSKESLKKHTELITLIADTESMDTKEVLAYLTPKPCRQEDYQRFAR